MCEGLPLGINVMARLMKGINDDINIWKYTQSKLEDSSMGEDMEKEVIKVLKRSYDHLADKTIQNCFLQHALYSDVSPEKLPTEFTNKYGLKLPNPVILKVVNGNQKKVHWTNINGSIWFIGKEWKEFLEHYSVSHGHLLLFKYCLDASYFRGIADAIKSRDRQERQDGNPNFEVVMRDSYINGGRCMLLP
ncbi:hypothetical protein Ahy_B10g106379 [Arachis hypogaea]|uniref:TF-B3 domain-containing protein n=1 Tax=Arachis hypogaea TaxID=3818 RepID=A0A444XAN0_ARAHY|nr:hypothetical protein Ahy_B10g106379 [Arachis hypogaea]